MKATLIIGTVLFLHIILMLVFFFGYNITPNAIHETICKAMTVLMLLVGTVESAKRSYN